MFRNVLQSLGGDSAHDHWLIATEITDTITNAHDNKAIFIIYKRENGETGNRGIGETGNRRNGESGKRGIGIILNV